MARTRQALDALIRKLENALGVTQATLNRSAPSMPEEQKLVPAPTQKSEPQSTQIHGEEQKVNLADANVDLFNLIDIRVGRIVECWKHPQSENLYCEKIDIGEPSVREIGSGLQKHIPIADMSGLVFVVANLKPRKLAGFDSNGMVLALHKPDGFELLRPPANSEVGERVGIESLRNASKGPILAHLNPKKKALENCLPFLMTDAEGYACFGTHKLVTSAGHIKTNVPHGHIS